MKLENLIGARGNKSHMAEAGPIIGINYICGQPEPCKPSSHRHWHWSQVQFVQQSSRVSDFPRCQFHYVCALVARRAFKICECNLHLLDTRTHWAKSN